MYSKMFSVQSSLPNWYTFRPKKSEPVRSHPDTFAFCISKTQYYLQYIAYDARVPIKSYWFQSGEKPSRETYRVMTLIGR